MSRRTCQCTEGDYVEAIYLLGGIFFDDSYCGLCSLPWARPKPATAPAVIRAAASTRGTSTSPEEATLRDIGRHVFGITYPEDTKKQEDSDE